MSDLYSISIKDHRRKSKRLLRENERCYESLTNKESEYARQVMALQKLHRARCEIYDNAPDVLQEEMTLDATC